MSTASTAARRLTGRSLIVVATVALVVAGAAGASRYALIDATPAARTLATVVASIRAEPRSFNRYLARDLTTSVVTYLMHSTLVRINRTTDQLEAELAESWEM